MKEALEPQALEALGTGHFLSDGNNLEKVAAASAAISLKRMADALERLAKRADQYDTFGL